MILSCQEGTRSVIFSINLTKLRFRYLHFPSYSSRVSWGFVFKTLYGCEGRGLKQLGVVHKSGMVAGFVDVEEDTSKRTAVRRSGLAQLETRRESVGKAGLCNSRL